MVGDPKQTIYQMKDARAEYFQSHKYELSETLPNNYRCALPILDFAHTVAVLTDRNYTPQICSRAIQQAVVLTETKPSPETKPAPKKRTAPKSRQVQDTISSNGDSKKNEAA